jgi:hypothetical protein
MPYSMINEHEISCTRAASVIGETSCCIHAYRVHAMNLMQYTPESTLILYHQFLHCGESNRTFWLHQVLINH